MIKLSLRNKLALVLLIVLVSASIFSFSFYFRKEDNKSITSEQLDQELDSRLDEFVENILSGGPPKDGIPPIDNPQYISVLEAETFLEQDDIVFIIESRDAVKVFPQKILVWHEIVNDVFNGEIATVTYCPLTGSAIGFKGSFNGVETTFGTSGKLVNSNLIMYDRASDSYWPQILGTAINGVNKGKTLEEFPVIWTRWDKVKIKHPNALVLSTETGFLRSYGSDPYGSYQEKGTYYDSGDPLFPVMATDDRLGAKEVVVGVKMNGSFLAILKKSLVEEKVVNLSIDDHPIVAFYDESLDTVRVYSRKLQERTLNFSLIEGKRVDRESESEWTEQGESISGEMKATELELVNSFDVMWFGWVAYYPHTEIYR